METCSNCVWGLMTSSPMRIKTEHGVRETAGKVTVVCRYGGQKKMTQADGEVKCQAWAPRYFQDRIREPRDWLADTSAQSWDRRCTANELMGMHGMPVKVYRRDGWSGWGIVEVNRDTGTFCVYNPNVGSLQYWQYAEFERELPAKESLDGTWWAFHEDLRWIVKSR